MTIERFLAFPHDYDVELLDDLPGGSQVEEQLYFPSNRASEGKDGIAVRVKPSKGAQWIGIFSFGTPSAQGLKGVFSCPDSKSLLVVSAGRGYFVRSDKPGLWLNAPCFPITDVRPVVDRGLLIFADRTTVAAWDKRGLLWRTPRIAWDEVKITEIDGEFLHGKASDPTVGPVDFQVNLKTGAHEGGSTPDRYRKKP